MEQFDKAVFDDAPTSWASANDGSLSSLHQLSPYIGKLKPQIARDLIAEYTSAGETVVDPFCGSGSIPLEAKMAGRNVVAADISPYAYLLTKAKLCPPATREHAHINFERTLCASMELPIPVLADVPPWVREFFHPRTLSDAIRFADVCIARKDHFLLSCFLGVLHHQRPGFLSYPSSHLVPYLRDKKFPRDQFPEMYEYRELAPRIRAKIDRAFKTSPRPLSSSSVVVRRSDIRRLELKSQVDAIITSPPYMNALDYRRDNRLRLWFLDRATQDYSPEPTDKRAGLESMVNELVSKAQSSVRIGGKVILVVGETVVRKRIKSHPSQAFAEALNHTGEFSLLDAIRDNIPDIRRARRDYQGTKTEHILVFEKRRLC